MVCSVNATLQTRKAGPAYGDCQQSIENALIFNYFTRIKRSILIRLADFQIGQLVHLTRSRLSTYLARLLTGYSFLRASMRLDFKHLNSSPHRAFDQSWAVLCSTGVLLYLRELPTRWASLRIAKDRLLMIRQSSFKARALEAAWRQMLRYEFAWIRPEEKLWLAMI